MTTIPHRPDPPPTNATSAVLPLMASGGTVLLIVLLLALAAQGATFALGIALAVMVGGCAACYCMIQSVSSRQEPDGTPADAVAEHPELSAHDFPLGAPGHHREPAIKQQGGDSSARR